jgi:hypothetical protein
MVTAVGGAATQLEADPSCKKTAGKSFGGRLY